MREKFLILQFSLEKKEDLQLVKTNKSLKRDRGKRIGMRGNIDFKWFGLWLISLHQSLLLATSFFRLMAYILTSKSFVGYIFLSAYGLHPYVKPFVDYIFFLYIYIYIYYVSVSIFIQTTAITSNGLTRPTKTTKLKSHTASKQRRLNDKRTKNQNKTNSTIFQT
jgi:hypothetical protein